MRRVFRIFGKALIVFGLAWVARWVLIRWVNGPPHETSSVQWNGTGAGIGTGAGATDGAGPTPARPASMA
jgi:hypothetical protein